MLLPPYVLYSSACDPKAEFPLPVPLVNSALYPAAVLSSPQPPHRATGCDLATRECRPRSLRLLSSCNANERIFLRITRPQREHWGRGVIYSLANFGTGWFKPDAAPLRITLADFKLSHARSFA